MLVHAICLAVLFFCHFIVMLLFLLNGINADGDGEIAKQPPRPVIIRVRKQGDGGGPAIVVLTRCPQTSMTAC